MGGDGNKVCTLQGRVGMGVISVPMQVSSREVGV